jgi:cyclophilin family peptidyl-prolyl cis-trans isomerase
MMRRFTLIALALLSLILAGTALAGNPQVSLQTNKGVIVLELYPDQAPKSVENFLAYVDSGFYNGTVFHRVIKDFMIQGGGFGQDMKQKDTRPSVVIEADNGLKNERGTLAMARTSDPNSATAQFFINLKDNAFLNHTAKTPRGWGYTVFGRVTEGMAVVDAIGGLPTGAKGPSRQMCPRRPSSSKRPAAWAAEPRSRAPIPPVKSVRWIAPRRHSPWPAPLARAFHLPRSETLT